MSKSQTAKYIFLVDDEPIQNEMLKDYLSENFDYTIKVYDNGEGAIKDLALSPEIIVLDFHLNAHLQTAQNGIQVLQAIKQAQPATKVIMLSGQDKLEVAVDSMKFGAYDYVVKGETAFSRMGNIITNINELLLIKDESKTLKKVILFLSILVLAIVCLYIYMFAMGH